MSIEGMNVAEVESLGAKLKESASRLESWIGSLDQQVGSSPWSGADALRFRNDWWPRHKGHLLGAIGDLAGFGQSALNNAAEQRQASGEGAVATNPGGAAHTPGAHNSSRQ